MNERKMSHEVFGKLLDELDGDGNEVLKVKNARYSAPDDALHNFRAGANFTGLTPAQTCWGYMSKHLIALKDMIDRNDFSNREDFLEKCKDPINYLRILWAIGNDEEYWKKKNNGVINLEIPKLLNITVTGKDDGYVRHFDNALNVHQDLEHDSFIIETLGIDENFKHAYQNDLFDYQINIRKDK